MRVTPTQQQLSYLQRIGTPPELLTQSSAVPAPIDRTSFPADDAAVDCKAQSSLSPGVAWLVVIAFLLLVIIGAANAQDVGAGLQAPLVPPVLVAPHAAPQGAHAIRSSIETSLACQGDLRTPMRVMADAVASDAQMGLADGTPRPDSWQRENPLANVQQIAPAVQAPPTPSVPLNGPGTVSPETGNRGSLGDRICEELRNNRAQNQEMLRAFETRVQDSLKESSMRQDSQKREVLQALEAFKQDTAHRVTGIQASVLDSVGRVNGTNRDLASDLRTVRQQTDRVVTRLDALPMIQAGVEDLAVAVEVESARGAAQLARMRTHVSRTAFMLAVAILLAVAVQVAMAERRMRRIEAVLFTQAFATEPSTSTDLGLVRIGAPARKARQAPAGTGCTPAGLPAQPTSGSVTPGITAAGAHRPAWRDVPTPDEKLTEMLQASAINSAIHSKPFVVKAPWRFGFATCKGNVRSENQDYGFCFGIGDKDILVVADGCGGVAHGRTAAYVAAVAAAESLTRTYAMSRRGSSCEPRAAATRAIVAAADRLALHADKMSVDTQDPRCGLRTTLIVVVADSRQIGFAHIGDGGGVVLQASGSIENLVRPQKDPASSNILTASLGPLTEGDIISGVINRKPGDLVLVGTDGIFDRVTAAFPKDVLRAAIQLNGDLQATAQLVVHDLTAFKEQGAFVFDDNVTLGLLGDGERPQLGAGFWSESRGGSPHGETMVESASLSHAERQENRQEKESVTCSAKE